MPRIPKAIPPLQSDLLRPKFPYAASPELVVLPFDAVQSVWAICQGLTAPSVDGFVTDLYPLTLFVVQQGFYAYKKLQTWPEAVQKAAKAKVKDKFGCSVVPANPCAYLVEVRGKLLHGTECIDVLPWSPVPVDEPDLVSVKRYEPLDGSPLEANALAWLESAWSECPCCKGPLPRMMCLSPDANDAIASCLSLFSFNGKPVGSDDSTGGPNCLCGKGLAAPP